MQKILKSYMPVTVLIACFNLAYSQDVNPQKPFAESEIGYIEILGDTLVPPSIKKCFIVPGKTVSVFDEDKDFFYFVCAQNKISNICAVPKYARYTTLMNVSEKRDSVYFRGPIEAGTVPFALFQGEELPVIQEKEQGWNSLVSRIGTNFNIFIPSDLKNVIFSKESKFAKFAYGQSLKGLGLYDGKWLPKEKVKDLEEKKKLRDMMQSEEWINLEKAARNGFIILKDGSILKGKRIGGDKTRIFFQTAEDEYSISIHDIAEMSSEEMKSAGIINDAKNLYLMANEMRDASLGECIKNCDKALLILEKNSELVESQRQKAYELKEKILDLTKNAYDFLAQNKLAIYDYVVFSKDVLDYHLNNGNILLKQKYWINPEQICMDCKGEGNIKCLRCFGIGLFKKKCERCCEGKVLCSICNGAGHKDCPLCRGNGYFLKVCPTCNRRGSVLNYYTMGYPGYYNQVVISGKSPVLYVGFSPYWYPCGRTSVQLCPVCDGSGRVKRECLYCKETGQVSCQTTQICVTCKGKSWTWESCDECKGTKKIACKTCSGKGFLGAPVIYPTEESNQSEQNRACASSPHTQKTCY